MSKELEALKEIRELFTCHDDGLLEKCSIIETALKDYENVKTRLDDTQTLFWENKNKVDAFDIIVNKEVEIGLLKGILHADKSLHTASYYNSHFIATYRHLTQEEFDLLKEVLL